MDRTSFLCCQSFLYPLSSSSIPDDSGRSVPNDSNESTAKRCHDVLLDGMNLSIEPCQNASFYKDTNSSNNKGANKRDFVTSKVKGQSTGPAYFLPQKAMTMNASTNTKMQYPNETKNRDNSSDDSSTYDDEDIGDKNVDPVRTDPTFCKVKLTLHTVRLPLKGMTTPVKKANRRNLSEIGDQLVGNDEAILIANIDGNCFQVDLNQIQSISIGQSGGNGRNEISKTDFATEISSCLILELPSCWFRIFPNSLIGNGNSSRGTDYDSTKFDAVRTKLERLLSDYSLLPFPRSYSGQILQPYVIEKRTGEDDNDDPLDCSRRCIQSYSQSWMDLILFDNVLESQYPEPRFKDIVNDLMTKIPKQVSLSFIEEDKWTNALELYENKIATKIKAFDGVIDEFWNETSEHSSNNKRRRKDEDSDESQSKIQDDCVGRYTNILKDHKKYVISKHELHLLPLRG